MTGRPSSIPGQVMLNTQHYKVGIKGKVESSREKIVPFPTPQCCSYRKGNIRVTFDNAQATILFIICCLPLFIISLALFSLPNFIPLSSLYILIATLLVSSLFQVIMVIAYLAGIYEVHMISFQTFFVWVFKIVVDTWKFSMLLLYIL